jgi:hypothetical protein
MLVRVHYEQLVYTLPARYPSMRLSTLVLAPPTHPHHKHIPPNIKHHRIPAPDVSFTRPNLPFLIEEIERHVKTDQQVTRASHR